jgi:Domain of unknown function (DUF4460)
VKEPIRRRGLEGEIFITFTMPPSPLMLISESLFRSRRQYDVLSSHLQVFVTSSFATLAGKNSKVASASSKIPDWNHTQERKKNKALKQDLGTSSDVVFRSVWRKFTLKVHPDLFTQYPELKEKNQESLTVLQGILAEAKSGEKTMQEMMKARKEKIEFYLRTEKADSFHRVLLEIDIPGGRCPDALGMFFAKLFKAANLPSKFYWGPEYWESSYVAEKPAVDEDGNPIDQEEHAAYEQAQSRARQEQDGFNNKR